MSERPPMVLASLSLFELHYEQDHLQNDSKGPFYAA